MSILSPLQETVCSGPLVPGEEEEEEEEEEEDEDGDPLDEDYLDD